MPDRYADAVRARRTELRELRSLLVGGHRGELRSCLALSRLAAAGDAAAALAALRREAGEHVRRGDRHVRAHLSARIVPAVAEVATAVAGRWASALAPPLRRIATERGLAMERAWPRLPAPRVPVLPPPAEPPGPSLLSGMVEGAALWRLVLFPLAGLPLLGLPALGGPALAPLAVGAGIGAVVLGARSRRRALERARLHRGVEQLIAAAAAAIDADLDRRLVELERAASAALDTAVLHRRAAIDRELARLTTTGPAQVPGG
jgi:hypothetical protein